MECSVRNGSSRAGWVARGEAATTYEEIVVSSASHNGCSTVVSRSSMLSVAFAEFTPGLCYV